MKDERKPRLHKLSKMVLWPIRAHTLFELFYNSISSIEVMRIKKNINLGIIS